MHGYKLPNTMDLTKWGLCKFNSEHTRAIINRFNSKITYKVFLYDNSYYVQVISETNKILFEFTDKSYTYIGRGLDLDTFERDFNNTKYNYVNGKIYSKTVIQKTNKIKPQKYKIITMDLECYKSNNKLIPICLSINDGDFI